MQFIRSRFIYAAVAAVLSLPAVADAAAYLRVVSWNTRHAGWSGETNYAGAAAQIWQQYGTASNSPNGCDLVFLQEVMYESAASGIASELAKISGVSWTYKVTPAIGRTSYKEMYAVLYRTDNVTLVSHSVYNDSSDLFEREPQIVKVRDRRTSADFTFINWHTIWGTTAEREAEVRNIHKVFNPVQNGDSTDQDVIIVGDHNASATSTWWSTLTSTANVSPVISYYVNDLTTINSSGSYANPYDHFWTQKYYLTEYSSSGRDYIANTVNFYNGQSDHAPVFLRLYSSSDTD